MQRFHSSFRIFGLLAALLWVGLAASQAALPSTGLVGIVKSSAGKPMEGVIVSARSQDKTFTTSVYTNHDGEYFFPPFDPGQYRVWAQTVGFETARSEQRIASGKKIQQNFTMKPMQDFSKQLSGAEWANSLPADTPEDRRMKETFQYICSNCHPGGYVLGNRFDAAGWGIIIDVMMQRMGGFEPVRKLYPHVKDDLAGYLAKVRGPGPSPMKLKPLPRATGEATQIVVTEYEIPRGDDPNYVVRHNGSDWSEGSPASYENTMLHDAVPGKDGYVYFTDVSTAERSLGRLDPKTGQVKSYKLAGNNGFAVSTHGAIVDPQGNIWLTNLSEGTMLKFDPKTESFQRFPKPASMTRGIGGTIAIDSKGNLWTTQSSGAFRLNPNIGEYTEYKSVTPEGEPYGITVDSKDNAWFAQIAADRLGVVNGRTGEVSEVVLPPVKEEFTAKDREIVARGAEVNGVPAMYQKGPRRLNADLKGDAVWVGEFWGGNLLKVDIHTKKVTEYRVPTPTGHPYTAVVDKTRMVWTPLMNGDRIEKFNPFTEKFIEYTLPTLGSNIRHMSVDDSTDVPTLWVPYVYSNKIARVEFRTGPARQMAGRQQARNRGN